MFGIEGANEDMIPLVEQIQASRLSIGSGLALLVFFAIALMCVSTLAILSREAQSRKLAVNLFVAYAATGYLLAVLTYDVAGWIGL